MNRAPHPSPGGRRSPSAVGIVVHPGLLVMTLPGAAAADGITGFDWVNPGFTVYVGQQFTADLAKNFWAASINCCAAPNPHVVWGDGNLDPDAAENRNNLEVKFCASGLNDHCFLIGTHTYQTPGVYIVTVMYNTGCCVQPTARLSIQVIERPGPAPDSLDSFVLVSVGDSVASGEGSPNVNAMESGIPIQRPIWEDDEDPLDIDLGPDSATLGAIQPDESGCHRSK